MKCLWVIVVKTRDPEKCTSSFLEDTGEINEAEVERKDGIPLLHSLRALPQVSRCMPDLKPDSQA